MQNFQRLILSLTDDELEGFVRDWIELKATEYVAWTRYSGSGDLGRDVVGFLSTARHEGPWDNYQCKQLGRTLETARGMLELGKILYYSNSGCFTPPTRYYFVAPKGVNRNFQLLLDKPSALRDELIHQWPKYCAEKIVKGQVITLEGDLLRCIESYDFSRVSRISTDDLLRDPSIRPVLAKWFGADLGAPPKGVVPSDVQSTELPYIRQLVAAYNQRDGMAYQDHIEVSEKSAHGPHLARQRERFYHAEAFKRYYRDNTAHDVLDTFEGDIYHGVVDLWESEHQDSLSCVEAVMAHVASVTVSGPLAIHARVPVRQGVCHHFANEDRIRWCR
jgi:hypothetical protein